MRRTLTFIALICLLVGCGGGKQLSGIYEYSGAMTVASWQLPKNVKDGQIEFAGKRVRIHIVTPDQHTYNNEGSYTVKDQVIKVDIDGLFYGSVTMTLRDKNTIEYVGGLYRKK